MQNAQSVYCPCRTLGVDTCVRMRLYVVEYLPEITVDPFYEIRAVLIALVYPPFQRQCLHRINMRVADDVF